MKLLEFACVGHRFAVPVAAVARVIPSAQPSPLPGAPAMVQGALGVGGGVVVLIDLARRFGLGTAVLTPDQRIVVLSVRGLQLGLVVDEPVQVTEHGEDIEALPASVGSSNVQGMVVASDGLRILLDPEHVLLHEDEERLRRAMGEAGHA